jgi:hypothetical protein
VSALDDPHAGDPRFAYDAAVRLKLAKTGPGVEAPSFLRAVILLDLLLATAAAVVGAIAPPDLFAERSFGLWLAGYAIAVAATDVFAARLAPKGLTWRRRLCFVAIVAVVWRGGPFSPVAVALPVILWSGLVWVALVTGGRALSRAIAAATGEDKPE